MPPKTTFYKYNLTQPQNLYIDFVNKIIWKQVNPSLRTTALPEKQSLDMGRVRWKNPIKFKDGIEQNGRIFVFFLFNTVQPFCKRKCNFRENEKKMHKKSSS